MLDHILKIRSQVLAGEAISLEDAFVLTEVPAIEIPYLAAVANEVRLCFAGNTIEACALSNIKSGNCSEDCKFCSQSGHYKTDSPVYDGQIVYIPLSASQRLLVCGEEVSIVGVKAVRTVDIETIKDQLSAGLAGKPVSVLTWKESAHEIVSIQEFQNAILLVVLLIIFAINRGMAHFNCPISLP